MKNYLIFIFLFSTQLIIGQEKMVVLKKGDSKSMREKPTIRTVDHQHVLKFDPFRMMVGELNFAIEEKLGERITAEISVGPTISNLTVFSGNFFDDSSEKRVSQFGGFFSAAIRFYPLDNYLAFNRFYVSPMVRYRRFNEDIIPFDPTLEKQKGFTNSTAFVFNVGFQQWISKSLSIDYYVGFGLGKLKEETFQTVYEYDPITYEGIQKFIKVSEDRAQFVFNTGIKIGIGWKKK